MKIPIKAGSVIEAQEVCEPIINYTVSSFDGNIIVMNDGTRFNIRGREMVISKYYDPQWIVSVDGIEIDENPTFYKDNESPMENTLDKRNEWFNGETVYFPSFDSSELYGVWDYHSENQAVTNLINIGVAFKTKERAIKCAKCMLNMEH